MPPQPLSKVRPDAGIALGPGALPARPHLAAMVAEIIAFWSEIELQRGRYLGALLGGNRRDSAVAMYLAIASATARRDALNAASEAALSSEEYELFSRTMKAARVIEKERNTFAHGLWGHSDAIPDGLLLVDPEYRLKDMLRVDTLMQQIRAGEIQWPAGSIQFDKSKIMVYREADLRRSLRSVSGTHRLTYYLASLPALPQGAARDQLRVRLSAELPHPSPWS